MSLTTSIYRDVEAAYEPYVAPPTGYDESRYPDRSGEGPFYLYTSYGG